MKKNWQRKLLAFLVVLMMAGSAIGQCIVPGATVVVQAANYSPLAADSGKTYFITGSSTYTLPNPPPTSVWRINFAVKSGPVTINPNGLLLDQHSPSANQTYYTGENFSIKTDGTNYFTTDDFFPLRTCDITIGDQSSSSVLTSAQLGPQTRQCYITSPAVILEVDVDADAGTPSVIVGKWHVGSVTNILSSALATGASGGEACSNSGGTTSLDGNNTCSATLQNTVTTFGDYLELETGGSPSTAHIMTVHVIYAVAHR